MVPRVAFQHFFHLPAYHRLVLGAGLAALGEKLLLGLRIEAVIDHASEIAEAGGEAGLVAVTHNSREFDRVPGLVVEDWAED